MLVVGFFYQEKKPTTNLNLTTVNPQITLPTSVTAKESATQVTIVSPATQTKVSAMAHDFYSTKNMRAFIAEAKKKPEAGGISYAARGLLECEHRMSWPSSLPYDSKQDSAVYAKRLEVLKHSQYLCQGMLPEEVTTYKHSMMQDFGDQEGDIRLKAHTELRAALHSKDPVLLRDQVTNWLAMKDPMMLENYGQEVMLSQSGAKNTFWFEGKNYTGEAIKEIRSAWNLAACEFGAQCDQFDLRVATACIEESRCFNSRFEYEQNGLYLNKPEAYQRVLAYQKRLVDAIKREDINAFIKPK
jgi:hypothetical protein